MINYDLPQDAEDYVHRIGRTARAGADGKAISLADEDGAFFLEAIEEYIKNKIPTEWAEDELFVTDYVRTARPKPRPKSGDVKKTVGGRGLRTKSTKPAAPPKPAVVTAPAAENTGKKKRRRPRRKKPSGEQGSPVMTTESP